MWQLHTEMTELYVKRFITYSTTGLPRGPDF